MLKFCFKVFIQGGWNYSPKKVPESVANSSNTWRIVFWTRNWSLQSLVNLRNQLLKGVYSRQNNFTPKKSQFGQKKFVYCLSGIYKSAKIDQRNNPKLRQKQCQLTQTRLSQKLSWVVSFVYFQVCRNQGICQGTALVSVTNLIQYR